MPRVAYSDLEAAFHAAMLHLGLQGERARLCARLFAETTRDGVYTHGLNRFPRFAAAVRSGNVNPVAEPETLARTAVFERWDAHRGPGNITAYAAMTRAIALAKQHGLGAIALANTNHWMRGGTYGWLAADSGVFGICWTNTLANLPPWGASTPALGNNPLVLAAPHIDPVTGRSAPVVLDMAMSQFSYGTLAAYSRQGDPLPVPGGYDQSGTLTTDAAAIEATQRALPIGFWKGSGLSLMLDLFAAALSGGLATHQFPRDYAAESGISQFFLAIDPTPLTPKPPSTQPPATEQQHPQHSAGLVQPIISAILASLAEATPIDPAKPIRYPGQQSLHLREENLRLGVPVDADLWHQLTTLTF